METNSYKEQGYIHFKHFFTESELESVQNILTDFHEKWLVLHEKDYKNGLINSHSITSSDLINKEERLSLFRFISQDKISQIVNAIFPSQALFLNTQLFFDPYNSQQNNYWHRDIQYTGMSIEEQKLNIAKLNVIHFRIPFKSELGIELIPTSHTNWDLEEELETRLALNGKKPSDALKRGKTIPLDKGDLLVFSANMIHRGLYGNNRFTLDIIFCDNIIEFQSFIDKNNHPTKSELALLPNSFCFNNQD